MTHPLAKLTATEATSTPTWKPWLCCQRQAPLPKPQQFNGVKQKDKKHTPTWQIPEKSSCPAPLTHTEQKYSHRFKLGIFSGEKNPLDFLCTHSKPFPSHSLTGKYIPELPGLSTFHVCLVLSAFSYRKEWQSHLCRLSRPQLLITEGRSFSGEWPQDKLHYFYSFRHNHVLLLYKKHEELT